MSSASRSPPSSLQSLDIATLFALGFFEDANDAYLFEARGDDKTCDVCWRHNGAIFLEFAAEQEFPYLRKYGTIMEPRVHPHCRCVLILKSPYVYPEPSVQPTVIAPDNPVPEPTTITPKVVKHKPYTLWKVGKKIVYPTGMPEERFTLAYGKPDV
jgi:hypothetical protein